MGKPQSIQHHQLLSVLEACCQRSTQLTIRTLLDNQVYEATFAGISRNEVKFDLREDDAATFPGSGLCCVVFCQDFNSNVFMTSVIDRRSNLQVCVSMPSEITVERRSSLRVPLDFGLRAAVKTHDGSELQVVPRDLSLTGMCIKYLEDKDLQRSTDTTVDITLRFSNDEINLTGTIGRKSAHNYGVIFSGSELDQVFEPPAALVRMYMQIRQQNLTQTLVRTDRCVSGEPVAIRSGSDN